MKQQHHLTTTTTTTTTTTSTHSLSLTTLETMSDEKKPVYVPKKHRKRQRQPERFHGAFSGGFSAGYFNTVGSKEGWEPTKPQEINTEDTDNHEEVPSRRYQPQRLEDFMDDQDHDEWGGPTSLRNEYHGPEQTTSRRPQQVSTKDKTNINTDIDDDPLLRTVMTATTTINAPQNVGRKLLQYLGWREGGSAAYVPADEEEGFGPKANDDRTKMSSSSQAENLVQIHLSKRRLRKIQLQQAHLKLPTPKLDTCGLGYEPFKDAPEFQAHKEKRKRLAQQKAKAKNRNVYRVSNALGLDKDDEDDQVGSGARKGFRHTHDDDEDDDHYLANQTIQDFVGTKSVGGFALREDDDDAYDDDDHHQLTKVSGKVRINTDEFETVAYEHSDSDENDETPARDSKNHPDVSGAFSAWTAPNGETGNTKPESVGLLSNGQPPLPGFVLGVARLPHEATRFPGPSPPANYERIRHVFGPNEHPLVLKTLSHAIQLQAADNRRKAAMDEALRTSQIAPRSTPTSAPLPTDRNKPLAGGRFTGLSTAMKDRFTSSTSEVITDTATAPAGLSRPQPNPTTTSSEQLEKKEQIEEEQNYTIVRRTVSFHPDPLLCKRFHIAALPKQAPLETERRTKEEAYFQDEILSRVKGAKSQATKEIQTRSTSKKDAAELGMGDVTKRPQRPPMDIYKSIFEPQSDASSSSEDEEELAPSGKEQHVPTDKTKATKQPAAVITSTLKESPANSEHADHRRTSKSSRKRSLSPSDEDDVDQSSDASDHSRSDRKRRKRERHKDDRKRKRRHEKKRKKSDKKKKSKKSSREKH